MGEKRALPVSSLLQLMKSLLNNSIALPAVLAILIVVILLILKDQAVGNVTATLPNLTSQSEQYRFFATSTNQTVFSTSTTALSTSQTQWTDENGRIDNGYFVVNGAERITFWFSREGKFGNAGTSLFDVDVSYDGITWADFSQMTTAGATSTPAYMATVSLTGTTTQVASMKLTDHNFYAVRCNVTETTDGEHFCKAQADY